MLPMGVDTHIRNPQRRRASTAVSSWGNFSPLNLRPFLWLDAADTSTITASSNAVSQWNDKSGWGRDVTQSVASAQPSSGTATENGLNVLSFDGGDILTRSGTTGLNVAAVTVYVVCKETTRRSFAGIISLHHTSGIDENNANMLEMECGNGAMDCAFWRYSGNAKLGTANVCPWGVFVGVYQADKTVDGYKDGVRSTNTGLSTDTNFGVAAGGIAIGGRYQNGNLPTNLRLIGRIGEIIIYPTDHTSTQRTVVETYLKNKWGTP